MHQHRHELVTTREPDGVLRSSCTVPGCGFTLLRFPPEPVRTERGPERDRWRR
jgi:hypothetical protein